MQYKRHKLLILMLNGVFDSVFHLQRDISAMADAIYQTWRDDSSPIEGLDLMTASLDGKPVTTAAGYVIQPDTFLSPLMGDTVIIPGFFADTQADIEKNITAPGIQPLYSWLRHYHQSGHRIATACTGTWLLGESRLLDHRQATTNWYFADAFSKRYPNVILRHREMVTVDSNIYCAGSAMANIDLVLRLLSDLLGDETIHQLSARLLLDQRKMQSHYMVTQPVREMSEDFVRINRWVRHHLNKPFRIKDLAAGVALSTRTLARRIHEATGKNPVHFIQRLRTEKAILLLKTTDLSFDEIVAQLGYGDAASLRRIIRQQTGRKPSYFRR